MRPKPISLISAPHFVLSARDSGYKSIGHALAELIDNSFEADATTVHVDLDQDASLCRTVSITDDGHGMKPSVLMKALQFGGSSRFNSRIGSGRYGMGLPNASLAMARQIEVMSWTSPNSVWRSCLDIDEIASQPELGLSAPRRTRRKVETQSGTKVIWYRCDKVELGSGIAWVSRLNRYLGQTFRKWLWAGKKINVNGVEVEAFDPLMMRTSGRLEAVPVGPPLKYEISLHRGVISQVNVVFTKLPLRLSEELSSKEKSEMSITRRAGVSIIRGRREIDYGWYFLGSKRRENYDDWWRCEITFHPELDELFGVTNTKQGIRPSAMLERILQPDMESIGRKLNAEVREGLSRQKEKHRAVRVAGKREIQLEPLARPRNAKKRGHSRRRILRYDIDLALSRETSDESFFEPQFKDDRLSLKIRMDHPFIATTLKNVGEGLISSDTAIHLMLLAASRAEEHLGQLGVDRELLRKYRVEWGRVLATFCE